MGDIKTALAGWGGYEDTNRDMIRGAVSVCVTMCERQKKEREEDTETEIEGGTLQYAERVEWKGSVVAACCRGQRCPLRGDTLG